MHYGQLENSEWLQGRSIRVESKTSCKMKRYCFPSHSETTETFPNRDFETSQDPWLRKSQYSLERVLHNSAHLLTRDPDGASVNEDGLANREANGDHMESQSDNSMGSHLGMDLHEPRGKKIKKASIFSCLCTTRLSSRKKTKKAGKSKKENTEVVKTI